VLNWGNTTAPVNRLTQYINHPSAVNIARNKLSTFQRLKDNNFTQMPEFTTNKDVAQQWLNERHKVVVRQSLTSYGGRGIVVVKPGETLPDAPLYTKYFKKTHEYRVHVFNGQVIDFTEKKHEQGVEPANPYIRNHDNGWVFCRENVVLPDNVKAAAIRAVAILGLDFGALDVGEKDGNVCLFEINSAPGVEGTTLEKYINVLRNYV
jgi:glutathione synthase/RimK-type ligase-like ATP-grasp enzyme